VTTADSFEVVIASFHTEARASEVVTQLKDLGHPAHARVVDEWQQVVAGPFANEAAADDAQRQLDREGFSGTKVQRAAP
jgi:cell division septation protein DedD